MEAADLGIVRYDDDRQANAAMFGDNFTYAGLQGEWQSPSIVMYDDDFNVLGVPGISLGLLASCRRPNIKLANRSQLWPYDHVVDPLAPPGQFSTVLPTDFIKIGEWWYVHVMVCRGLGNELWTEWQRSRDLVNWEWLTKVQPPQPNGTMLTFDVFGDSVFIFGTGGLARSKPIWGWKCPVDAFPHLDVWQPLNNGNPVLVGGFGELCFRNVAGRAVLSYFDAFGYKMSARMQSRPDNSWATVPEFTYTTGLETPQCYGGYITPDSTPEDMGFIVSQWNTMTNDPYKAMLYRTSFGGAA
jgi:hypothetical protein